MWMNRYEIENLQRRFDADEQPNARRGATILNHLMIWTDRNSDGWPYWQKPSNAADKLMTALREADEADRRGVAPELADVGDAELAAALRPIKAFLTRQKVDADTKEWIVDPDAAVRRAAEAAAAAQAAKIEALHEEARAYARKHDPLDYSNVTDAIADAYFAGATR